MKKSYLYIFILILWGFTGLSAEPNTNEFSEAELIKLFKALDEALKKGEEPEKVMLMLPPELRTSEAEIQKMIENSKKQKTNNLFKNFPSRTRFSV